MQMQRWCKTFVWCLLVTFGLHITWPSLPVAASPAAPAVGPPAESLPPFSRNLMATLGAAPLAPQRVHFAPDPVNLSNGNLYLPMRDLYLPAYRFPLTIDRAYNSRSTADGPFGFGWSFNYGVKIRQDAAGLLIQEGDGSTRRYQSSKNGFEAKIGAYSRITKSADGSYVRTRAGGIRERFDAKGRLVRMEDGNGYWVQLTYRNDRLTTVQDGAGRSLTFTYNARGKIATITDPLGRTLQYQYADRGDLSVSTDLSGHETRYAYDDLHNLIGIRYADGAETTMTYDTQRDLIISEHGPGGRLTSYQYLLSPATPDQYSVVAIDGLGRQTAHAFRKAPDGMTLTTTDPLGGTTTKTYDARQSRDGERCARTDDPLPLRPV
jgi:YD repeat-containing protein